MRLRAFSCHRCSCWLRHRCSCWLRCWGFCWMCHRCSGCRRARPLAVRAASFARRVGSKPGQALRPRRRPPLWWLVVRVDWSGPLHLQPSYASIAGHSTNFACNSLVTISNREFAALELQRFLTWLNLRPIELHATFGGGLAVRLRPPHRWLVVRDACCPAMSFCCRGCSICFPGPCPSGPIGIGCAHLDRLCASG